MFSTRQAAKKLKIEPRTLSRYVQDGKLPAPKMFSSGKMTVHLWTEEEIEQVRQLLPKIKNGRKTRYQKQKKKQNAQPRAAVPHKKKSTKKKK